MFDSKNIDKRSVALPGDISKRITTASFHLKYIFSENTKMNNKTQSPETYN